MKKALILIIAGVCLLQINGLSQKTEVGLTGGLVSSNIYGQIGGNDTRGDARTGFTLGMLVDAPIGKTNFSFQPSVNYVQKGMWTSKTSTTKEAIALRYAEFLLNFVHYTKGKSTRLYFGLGPSLGLNLPSKKVTITNGSRIEESILFGKTSADRYRGVDWGANGLLGIRFKSGIIFSVNYTFGLRNLVPIPTGDDRLRNGCLGLRLGYIFKNAAKVVAPVVLDRDGDGVPDNVDACPDNPGPAATQGCPDSDGDGILDKDDKCPTVKGLPKYEGCPIPDSDKDGINDEEDKCPTVPGLARYQGCPVPDTDGDGINDEEDKCPNLKGVPENQGCPVIPEEIKKKVNLAAKNILFETGSAKLRASSFKGLNEVVKILQENPDMELNIDGHTDNVGSDEMNQTLSDNRAASVKNYITGKGIDESRIKSAGHGESMPIADNKTAAGRQQNRRVELLLTYFQ